MAVLPGSPEDYRVSFLADGRLRLSSTTHGEKLLTEVEQVTFRNDATGMTMVYRVENDQGTQSLKLLTAIGSDGDDIIKGNESNNVFISSNGLDKLDGLKGSNTVSYINEASKYDRKFSVDLLNGYALFANKDDRKYRSENIADNLKNIENILGGKFDDILAGNHADNIINGGFGNDKLFGYAGDDILVTGTGNDYAKGGRGRDLAILPGEIEDYSIVSITKNNLTLNSLNYGTKSLTGIEFLRFQEDKSEKLYTLTSYKDKLDLIKNTNPKLIEGSPENDILTGTEFSDYIVGGTGNDIMKGSAGSDMFAGGEGYDVIYGGAGKDSVSYINEAYKLSQKFHVDLTSGVALYADKDAAGFYHQDIADQLYDIEHLIGGLYDDIFFGDVQNNVLDGGGGNDKLFGRKGDDKLITGMGNDYVYGGDGQDTVLLPGKIKDYDINILSNTKVQLSSSIYGTKTTKNIERFAFLEDSNAYFVNIKSGKEFTWVKRSFFDGTDRDDSIIFRSDLYKINGLDGFDTVSYYNESVMNSRKFSINLKSGIALYADKDASKFKSDKIANFIQDVEGLIGGNYDDRLIGDYIGNVLSGGWGDDYLSGGGGNDVLITGFGSDIVDGGSGRRDVAVLPGLPNSYRYESLADGGLRLSSSFYGTKILKNVEYVRFEKDSKGPQALYSLNTPGYYLKYINDSSKSKEIWGDASNNYFYPQGNSNVFYGYEGNDSANYLSVSQTHDKKFLINLGTGHVIYADKDAQSFDIQNVTDELHSVENVYGGKYDDKILGNEKDNIIFGNGGSDYIEGRGGNDTFKFGPGHDIVDGGYGLDVMKFESILMDYKIEKMPQGLKVQSKTNNENVSELRLIEVLEFQDSYLFINNYNGKITLELKPSSSLDLSYPTDFLLFIDNFIGTYNGDTLLGNNKDNVIDVKGGNDEVRGGKGNDWIDGGSGNDKLNGQEGDDLLVGGAGNDIITGGSGNDIIYAGIGDDRIVGGHGIDTVFLSGKPTDYKKVGGGDNFFLISDKYKFLDIGVDISESSRIVEINTYGATKFAQLDFSAYTNSYSDGDFLIVSGLPEEVQLSTKDVVKGKRDSSGAYVYTVPVSEANSVLLKYVGDDVDLTNLHVGILERPVDGNDKWTVAERQSLQASLFELEDGAANNFGHLVPNKILLVEKATENSMTEESQASVLNMNGILYYEMVGRNSATRESGNETGKIIGKDQNAIAEFYETTGGDAHALGISGYAEVKAGTYSRGSDRNGGEAGIYFDLGARVTAHYNFNEDASFTGSAFTSVHAGAVAGAYVTDDAASAHARASLMLTAGVEGTADVELYTAVNLGFRGSANAAVWLVADSHTNLWYGEGRYGAQTGVALWAWAGAFADYDATAGAAGLEGTVWQGFGVGSGSGIAFDTVAYYDNGKIVLGAKTLGAFYIKGMIGFQISVDLNFFSSKAIEHPYHDVLTDRAYFSTTYYGDYTKLETETAYREGKIVYADGSIAGSASNKNDKLALTGPIFDIFHGLDGDDRLLGSWHDDHINGGSGNDRIFGKDGDDYIVGGLGNDKIWGGLGHDTLSYSDRSDYKVSINLASFSAYIVPSSLSNFNSDSAEIDKIYSIENIIGTDNDDIIIGNYANNVLLGGGGNDVINGKGGDDLITGGLGLNELDGGDGVDTVSYRNLSTDLEIDLSQNETKIRTLIQDRKWDDIFNFENAIGGKKGDLIIGNSQANILDGSLGNDELRGDAGDDFLIGGHGDDELLGGAGNDILEGGIGDDILTGGLGVDEFIFTENFGDDAVTDFTDGADLIFFDISDITYADLTITDDSGHALVAINGHGTIKLTDLEISLLNEEDFIFI